MAKEFYVLLAYHYSESGVGTVVARLPGGASVIGQIVAPNKYHLPGVPTDSEIDVEIQRPHDEILLRTRLKLGRTGASRFVWGKPKMMDFLGAEPKRPTDIILQVNLYPPQEVILCTGRDGDKGNSKVMGNFANRRMAGMLKGTTDLDAGRIAVNDSCVFTVFEWRGKNSRIHHLLPGSGKKSSDLPGDGFLGCGVKIGDFTLPKGTDHLRITDVYDYLAECGQKRQGTVMALEFISHGALGGPALENTWRRPTADPATSTYWDQAESVCSDECPNDIRHGIDTFLTPGYFNMLEYGIDNATKKAVLRTNDNAMLSVRPFVAGYPDKGSKTGPRVEHKSRANFEVVSTYEGSLPEDADPRSTDFLFMQTNYLKQLQDALHSDCIIRTWGCMWGDEGPRLFEYSRHYYSANGPENRRLDIHSDYDMHGSPISQRWLVRHKDAWLHFLSLTRRTYAQAIATYLQRPCYSALPGNWASFEPTTHLQGMQIPTGLRGGIQKLAKGVLQKEFKLDEAGYVRYFPAPVKAHVVLKVLVTGFRPFSNQTVNASQETVKLLTQADVLKLITVPSWIDLDLQLQTIDDVDVVWTCDASVDPSPGTSSHVRGGAGIVDYIQKMPDGGPDIVLLVGEAQQVIVDPKKAPPYELPGPQWFRLEAYAHNSGGTSNMHADNESHTLLTNTPTGSTAPIQVPIFDHRPDYLETSIPRLSYLQATERLFQHPYLRPFGYLPTVAKFDFPVGDGDKPKSLLVPPIPPQTDPRNQSTAAAQDIANINANRLVTPVGPAGDYICNETYYHLLLESQIGYEAKKRVGGKLTTIAKYPASGRWVLFTHVFDHRDPADFHKMAQALAIMVASICEDMLWAVRMHGRNAPVKVTIADGRKILLLDGKNGLPTS